MIQFKELSLWKSFNHDETKTFADNVCNAGVKELIENLFLATYIPETEDFQAMLIFELWKRNYSPAEINIMCEKYANKII